MSCCGNKRASMTIQGARMPAPARHASNPIPDPARPAVAPAAAGERLLRHARGGAITLRGPYSGRVYSFSPNAATAVRAEDAGALLRTGLLIDAER
jgi:hypothetical protein